MIEALTPLLLGIEWMDPAWWLNEFGDQMFWASVAIIFIECGLLFPILPGDSLLFAVGLFIATDQLDFNIGVACLILAAAAFAGNVVGYEIGRKIGPPLFHREGRFLNTKNYEKTHTFFEKYGNKALVLGRFVPIVRTFITVIAGAGEMDRKRFFGWSFVGAVLWATGLTLIGYFLGDAIPSLEDNLEAAILLIVGISVLPMLYEWWRHRSTVEEVK
ncbi:MAG TPA: VTT domain-containing protein [Nocardioidaceae bacterium]|nr:VTT domain-containing protein [Nocardioidaceae bacterium]